MRLPESAAPRAGAPAAGLPLSRRRVLQAAVAVAVALVVKVVTGAGAPNTTHAQAASEEEADGIAPVGRAYLAAYPEEGTPAELRRVLRVGSSRGLERRLRDFAPRVRRDFAVGDVVSLEGWRLSRTEARLAALVYLTR